MTRDLGIRLLHTIMLGCSVWPVAVSGDIAVTWLGVAGLHISDGETAILIDPYITRISFSDYIGARKVASDRQLVADWIHRHKVHNVRAVLVSESHFDHSLDAAYFADLTGAPLVGSTSTANIGRGVGLLEEQIRIVPFGHQEQIGKFSITFMESRHTPIIGNHVPDDGFIDEPLRQPANPHDFKMGGHYSYLIQHPDGNLITHATPFDDLRGRNLDKLNIKAIFMSVLARRNTEDFLRRVVDPVNPAILYPIHCDNFFAKLPAQPKDLKLSLLARIPGLIRTVSRRSSQYDVRKLELFNPVSIHGI